MVHQSLDADEDDAKKDAQAGRVQRETEDRGILCEGPEDAELTIVGWGSTFHILEEARRALTESGHPANLVQFRTLWPFPAQKALPLLQGAKRIVCVENNYGGSLARLIRQETGFKIPFAVHKFDGEPFSIGPLVKALEAVLAPACSAGAMQVLVSSELDIPVVFE